MEVINGGYGIKNPLLSPDIHIQPVSVDENINGNKKKCTTKLSSKDSDEPVFIRAVSPEPPLFTHTILE